jgi:protein gp37
MSDHSHIQWTDATWSVTTGCTKVSSGCINCYIERTPPFRMAGRKFDNPGIGGTTGVVLHPERLTWPLRWRKPRRIFVDSLADLFHEEVPDEFIAETFAVMALAPQHTFQVLTKRHARLRSLLNSRGFRTEVQRAALRRADGNAPWLVEPWWPLRNVWVGVSAEDQQWADARIPALRETLAAVRFVSAEPLIGPIRDVDLTGIDWLIAGGESGPGARSTDPDWIRSLVGQCRRYGVAPFVKQLGSPWARDRSVGGQLVARTDPKGGDWQYWPSDLRVREYPQAVAA